MSNSARYTLETFTALTMDGGGQSIGVIDTAQISYGYVATFSQGWEQSAQTYVDGLNAEDAEMNAAADAAADAAMEALMSR